MSEPIRYEIRTLKDIFELPTMRAMQACLNELPQLMIQARASNDMIVELMNAQGLDAKSAIEWPDAVGWTDDGKGDIEMHLNHEGETLMSIKTKATPPQPAASHE